MRLSRSELAQQSNSLRSRYGEIPAETEGGELIPVPPGQTAPTAPGRTPTRSIPKSRDRTSLIEPLIDTACSLFNPNPGGFVDKYLDFSEYTSSRSVADVALRAICGSPPGSPSPPAVQPQVPLPPQSPYSGGQCPGTEYTVSYTIRFGSDPANPQTETRTSSRDWIGPIGSVSRTGPLPGTTSYEFFLTHDLDNPNGQRRDRLASTSSPAFPATLSISSVTPQGGATDDCGDPPAEPGSNPSSPTPRPLPPTTYDPGDGGPPVTISPDLSIEIGEGGPQLRFELPDVTINVDVGGVNINYPSVPAECCPPNAISPLPDDFFPSPEDPDPPNRPPGIPSEPDDDDEPQTAMRAVVVTASGINTPATPIVPANGAPTVYAPRLGSLQFKIAAANGIAGWTGDIDIKNEQQYVVVPAPQGAVDVRVFPYGATLFDIQRIYQRIDSELGEG